MDNNHPKRAIYEYWLDESTMESTNKFTGTSLQLLHRRGYFFFFAQRKSVGIWLKRTLNIFIALAEFVVADYYHVRRLQ